MEKEEIDDFVCLDESFFINDDYQLTTFTFGSQVLQLYCLQSASTDFDLTGQLVWPGAVVLNEYLSKHVDELRGLSVLELGSGVGVTGILCGRFCNRVVMTDHNDEVIKILKKNIDHVSAENNPCADLVAEKLEWGSSDQINALVQRYPEGFDLILGADICFQQSSIPLLFRTVEQLLQIRGKGLSKFVLSYVSRAKVMDEMICDEANRHGLSMKEVTGTRSVVQNLEGVVYEIVLQ
ncbi:hypothetical protein RND81_04G236800 [Saponaria officinalis]|uniref:Protein N-lysine methyltransferase METTL21A n=1 Tax=Saponaria officinalis TaxID=3572 RepID=A0AAW1LHH5_SAPOF